MSPAMSTALAVIAAIGGTTGIVALLRVRSQNALSDAEAKAKEAEAEETEAKAEQLKEELRLSVLESVRADMARQREETARAQAAEKEALAELAILIAKHERDRADWRQLKHDYEDTIRAQSNEIEILRREIETLREEVRTLRVALDLEEGRRKDDPPRT